jgi:hypothetical protein
MQQNHARTKDSNSSASAGSSSNIASSSLSEAGTVLRFHLLWALPREVRLGLSTFRACCWPPLLRALRKTAGVCAGVKAADSSAGAADCARLGASIQPAAGEAQLCFFCFLVESLRF